MKKQAWLRIGGWCLAAGLAAGLAGCGKPISDVKDLVVALGPRAKTRFVYIPALKLYVGKYEISNKEYRCFKPSHDSGTHRQMTLNQDDQPAVQVSWNDASAFAVWMTEKYGAGRWRFRLPTEREWETVAACGQPAEYPWGDGPVPRNWNYFGRENPEPGQKLDHNDRHRVSCPVQKSGANAWGLFGIGGNVWEWCEDTDDAEGKTRVLKGASWSDCAPLFLTIARRSSYTADYKSANIGLRLVAEPSTGAPETEDIPAQPEAPPAAGEATAGE